MPYVLKLGVFYLAKGKNKGGGTPRMTRKKDRAKVYPSMHGAKCAVEYYEYRNKIKLEIKSHE
jgi:hypothetical protein